MPTTTCPAHSIVTRGEKLYVSRELDHRVEIRSPDGGLLETIGTRGPEPGALCYPNGLAVHDDMLFVCDSWNHRVQVFDAEGRFIRSFGSLGDGADGLREPTAICVGPDGNLWITDSGNHRIAVWTSDGRPVSRIGVGPFDARTELSNRWRHAFEGRPLEPAFSFPRAIIRAGDAWTILDAEHLHVFDPARMQTIAVWKLDRTVALIGSREDRTLLFDRASGMLSWFGDGVFEDIATIAGFPFLSARGLAYLDPRGQVVPIDGCEDPCGTRRAEIGLSPLFRRTDERLADYVVRAEPAFREAVAALRADCGDGELPAERIIELLPIDSVPRVFIGQIEKRFLDTIDVLDTIAISSMRRGTEMDLSGSLDFLWRTGVVLETWFQEAAGRMGTDEAGLFEAELASALTRRWSWVTARIVGAVKALQVERPDHRLLIPTLEDPDEARLWIPAHSRETGAGPSLAHPAVHERARDALCAIAEDAYAIIEAEERKIIGREKPEDRALIAARLIGIECRGLWQADGRVRVYRPPTHGALAMMNELVLIGLTSQIADLEARLTDLDTVVSGVSLRQWLSVEINRPLPIPEHPGSGGRAPDADRFWSRALLKNGRLDEARAILSGYGPESGMFPAQVTMHLHRGDPESARATLEDLPDHRDDPAYLEQRCRVALSGERFDEALEAVSHPAFPAEHALFYRCAVRLARGEAEAVLHELEHRPYAPFTLYWKGVAARKSARFDEAMAAFDEESRRNPLWLVALQRAVTAAAMNDGAALEACVRALPDHAALFWRGVWVTRSDPSLPAVLGQLAETEKRGTGPDLVWYYLCLLQHPRLHVFPR